MDIGQAVKILRRRKGFTQKKFCQMVGITQSYLSQVENGLKTPSMDVIKSISESLGVPLAVLFWFTLTAEDVREDKLVFYQDLKPAIDNLVYAFFKD